MRLLDLFCGAGGSAVGYHRAGFEEIVGVDNRRQPHYPFSFVLGDALEYVRERGREFDAVHASPPCQAYSRSNNTHKRAYPELIDSVRSLLRDTGKPYIIENVRGAPLCNPIMLCGASFGLKVYRHRNFESNVFLFEIPHTAHNDRCLYRSGHGPTANGFVSIFGHGGGKGWQELGIAYADYARMAMGIDWMNKRELSQAIPPAYTEYIGKQLLAILA